MKSTTPPRPIEVKAAQVWRSTDGASLGFFPGIFSTVGNAENLSFLISAFAGIDPFDALDATLYDSAEACMAAWDKSGYAEVKKGTMLAIGLSAETIEQINGKGLYRDPALDAADDNPWRDNDPSLVTEAEGEDE